AGLWNLALMAQKQPAPGKDLFLLGLVDFRLNVNAAADETTLAVDHSVEICRHRRAPSAVVGMSRAGTTPIRLLYHRYPPGSKERVGPATHAKRLHPCRGADNRGMMTMITVDGDRRRFARFWYRGFITAA